MLKNCCGACGGSDPCGCGPSASFACVSSSTDGASYIKWWGFRFANFNNGDTYATIPSNQAFYRYVSLSGTARTCDYTSNASCNVGGSPYSFRWDNQYQGTGEVDPADGTAISSAQTRQSNEMSCSGGGPYGCTDCTPTSWSSWSDVTVLNEENVSYARTTRSSLAGCVTDGSYWYKVGSGAFMQLSGSLSPLDGTVFGTVSAGTLCTTSYTSTRDFGFYGESAVFNCYGNRFRGTTVRATITMNGVVASSSYDLTITLSKYNTSTFATTEEQDVVTVTADTTGTDTYTYDVPIEEGYEITITAVAIAAA